MGGRHGERTAALPGRALPGRERPQTSARVLARRGDACRRRLGRRSAASLGDGHRQGAENLPQDRGGDRECRLCPRRQNGRRSRRQHLPVRPGYGEGTAPDRAAGAGTRVQPGRLGIDRGRERSDLPVGRGQRASTHPGRGSGQCRGADPGQRRRPGRVHDRPGR